ncbi:UDP-N-acetylmuramoyl-L-alanyl-D-glutamate--L-lysine ligase [Vagococcus coleopterorum]|uniref:UDP-N-acetylmuramyl-tripeptide synthetase n=1 Tax=Vagococcus coleopterorum TaxID=2714946 RepID=A0A6G8ANN9_9ENTE|nr:UDP-N-acetylmuramoyl-L-alanyl-D-glutamate--L-lysine ligase [Vagococcus coleopterorum]QIL46616.1 UDP-N-acetylmuramoyl-L-alanyl-D-glutamate--L-lysine ligase [Vagococcus coleopterorum]
MLSFNQMINLLTEHQLLKEYISNGVWHFTPTADLDDKTIKHITYDSRAVTEGSLFFCKGLAFKVDYLEQALAQGASFYVTEKNYELETDAIGIVVTDIKKAMAVISMAFYNYPQDDLKIIAYTGTKGKTTAAYFSKFILDVATQSKTALLSTMETILDGKTATKSLLTTPEAVDLYRMMAEAVSNGMTHLVMEVSSQAYKTQRVYGLDFDVAIFLNISEDHIGTIEHPDFDDYFYCKRQLMTHAKEVIINRNSDFVEIIEEVSQQAGANVTTYGDDSVEADYTFVSSAEGKGKFVVTSTQDSLNLSGDYQINLLGDFNQGNALSAMIATALVGATSESMITGLELAKVPGRMDTVTTNKGVPIYVDFAHNLLSLQTLLSFVKKEHADRRLVVVIGSTGGKGESRRKDFGNVLSELADVAILTSDDPGTESAKDIAAEIESYLSDRVERLTELNRAFAIKHALETATEKDVIVLAGKGSDKYQVIGTERTPYEGDLEIATKLIEGGL